MPTVTQLTDATAAVRGFLHTPDAPSGIGLVLAHGAGSDAGAPLLVAVAEMLTAAGITVLRIDLPFRQARPHGPPSPAMAAQDRAGLKSATLMLRARVADQIFLGGQSYGGRQACMLAADEHGVAAGLLLLSYPLHAPGRPDKLRTEHFPRLTTPTLFIHGTRDPFGSIDEMNAALVSIPGAHELVTIGGVGHDLGGKRAAATIRDAFLRFSGVTS